MLEQSSILASRLHLLSAQVGEVETDGSSVQVRLGVELVDADVTVLV